MQKRIAVVFWWAGAMILIFGLGNAGRIQFRDQGCKSIFAEERGLEQKAIDASKKAESIAKAKAKADGKSLDFIDEIDAIVTVSDLPKRKGFNEELASCKGQTDEDSWITLFLCVLVALPFLIIAYILGGSFFRPPKGN